MIFDSNAWLLDFYPFRHTQFPNTSGIRACAICVASIIKATGAACHAHLAYRSSLQWGNSAFATWCLEILAVQSATAPSAVLRSFNTHSHTFFFFSWTEVTGLPVRHLMKARSSPMGESSWGVTGSTCPSPLAAKTIPLLVNPIIISAFELPCCFPCISSKDYYSR